MGLAINIGVAWCQTALDQWDSYQRYSGSGLSDFYETTRDPQQSHAKSLRWPTPVPTDWPARPNSVIVDRTWRCTLTSASAYVGRNGGDMNVAFLSEYGWPLRSLRSWWYISAPWSPNQSVHSAVIRVPQNKRWPGLYELPVLPDWPGLVLNTIFFSALAWGFWQLPLNLRRSRRRARGQCVRCGYALAGLPPGSPCPECGPSSAR